MKVSLKNAYRGQLGLKLDYTTHEYYYILIYSEYPSFERKEIRIKEGDELTIRNPSDGSILIHRKVEFDYDKFRIINLETGGRHQVVSNIPVTGVLTNIEPTYWMSLFTNAYPADLVREE